MPGTSKSGRPGGNPDLDPYRFQKKDADRASFTENMQVRITPEMKAQLKEIENWHQFVRDAIQAALDKLAE